MGVLIKCKNEVFTHSVGKAEYPIISALKNLYYLGVDATKTTKDQSGNNNTATIQGTVTYETKYVNFAGSNQANRMLAQTTDGTKNKVAAIALVRKTGNRGVVGNANASATPAGFVLGTERLIYGTGGAWKDLRFTLADSNNFYVLGTIISDSNAKVYKYDANGLSTIATLAAGNVTLGSDVPICIGGTNYNWSFSGSIDLAAVSYYEGAVTESQLSTAMQFLRQYAELKSLPVN